MCGHAARAVWNEPPTCTARWRVEVVVVDVGDAGPPHDAGVVDQRRRCARTARPRASTSACAPAAVDDVVGVGDRPRRRRRRSRRRPPRPVARRRRRPPIEPPRSLTTTLRAALGEQARVGAADAAPGAGDDGDAPVEAERRLSSGRHRGLEAEEVAERAADHGLALVVGDAGHQRASAAPGCRGRCPRRGGSRCPT